MKQLLNLLRNHPEFERLREALANGRNCRVQGLWGSSVAYLLAALKTIRLVLVPRVEEAEELVEDLKLFGVRASLFPVWEGLPGDEFMHDSEVLSTRSFLLKRMLMANDEPSVLIAPIQAVLQPVPESTDLAEDVLLLRTGQTMPPERLCEWLVDHGFQSTPQVELQGEFSRRGGIVDVFPFSNEMPYRIEFFGDEVESIRTFDPSLQKSDSRLDECELVGSGSPQRCKTHSTVISYLGESDILAMVEPEQIAEYGSRMLQSSAAEIRDRLNTMDDIFRDASRCTVLSIRRLPPESDESVSVEFRVRSLVRFEREISSAIAELINILDRGCRTIVLCNNDAELQRLKSLLKDRDVLTAPNLELRIGHLNKGFEFCDLNLVLLPEHEMFQRYQLRRPPRKPVATRAVESFFELEVGDYVVHAAHGIARFLGLRTLERNGKKEEFLCLEFEGKTKLYVPASQIELVQKYVGGTDRPPALSKLGGKIWQHKKELARKAVEDLASELLRIQAVRSTRRGIAYPPYPEWQHEFEAAFIYTETPDQTKVSLEIKDDMASPKPMDRLICGDVGYGKTELAMRAAFRAVVSGKQVAVLVPTTILAQQHFRTFKERMADYPITIEMLSRFKTRAEQREIVERLKEGTVDIVIGTHRLLQKDISFMDLGLVIIDEEQRFGVRHKEHLKKLRETVDILTLTATPIPRTLHMALLGIRDISTLETPPMDRLSIQTRLWRFDPQKIRQAILLELNRDGQVFFVHNRVHNIEKIRRMLESLVPEARFTVAHGQMPERDLERRMLDFVEHRVDVLVCTTIIESGLDIPNANTIFINNAHEFGLAELHQLRGRVGRYKHRAYAYFLIPKYGVVNPVAEKRLKAIEEFSELGAGFKIAMRDLEIRGAGNILGPEQHGHIEAVGYDMYCRLLEIAIRKARNEEIPVRLNVNINLGLPSYLPEDYIPDINQRVEIYRRLNRAEKLDEVDSLAEEIRDRFGRLPRSAEILIEESRLRLLAARAMITSMFLSDGVVILESKDPAVTRNRMRSLNSRLRHVDDKTFHLVLPAGSKSPEKVLEYLKAVLADGAST